MDITDIHTRLPWYIDSIYMLPWFCFIISSWYCWQSRKRRSRAKRLPRHPVEGVAQLIVRPNGSVYCPYPDLTLAKLFRVNPEDLCMDARCLLNQVHPDDVRRHLPALISAARNLRPWAQEFRLKFEDKAVWLSGTALPHRLEHGLVLWEGVFLDISREKCEEEQQKAAASVFEAQLGMLVTDSRNNIIRVNKAFTQITGYRAEHLFGKNVGLFRSSRHDDAFYAGLWNCLQRSGNWEGEIWSRRHNGELFTGYLTITTVQDPGLGEAHYVATLTDITQDRAAAEKIEHLAFYDPLTDLPNRRLLHDRLIPALALSQRNGREGAVLFIDLDHFKHLNDTFGHDQGDLLLQQVANRLESCVRDGDIVARLGGDEFVVVLVDLSAGRSGAVTQVNTVGEKILEVLAQPYTLADNISYQAGASIGATIFKGHRYAVEELLKQADIALYKAKNKGRNTLCFFDAKAHRAHCADVRLEEDLRLALNNRQFELYYQPQISHDRQVGSVEALIRWRHPKHGLVQPGNFIALAEETGLILPIGQWVLETACAQLRRWKEQPFTRHLQLAVNISARQFHQPDFVRQVADALQANAVSAGRLILEITERVAFKHLDETIVKMDALRKLGVQFAVDNFGTGHLTLRSLKKLPFSQLKIDQSFIHGISNEEGDTVQDDAMLVDTIIAMASHLGMTVIAEGVETDAQNGFLKAHGCTDYQGYLFSRALPIAQLEAILH